MNTICPYCGKEIQNEIEQCPFCKEFFVEPQLKDFKLTSIWLFFIADSLTLGLFSYFWILLNKNAFKNISNRLFDKKLDNLYKWLFINLWIILVSSFFSLTFAFVFYAINFVLFIMLSDIMILIIQRHTKKKYKVEITHNSLFKIIFRILYVVHYIEMYKLRVLYPKKSNYFFVLDY